MSEKILQIQEEVIKGQIKELVRSSMKKQMICWRPRTFGSAEYLPLPSAS